MGTTTSEKKDFKSIYFYSVKTLSGVLYSDFWIGNSPDEIVADVLNKMNYSNEEFEVRVQGHRPLADFKEFLPKPPKVIQQPPVLINKVPGVVQKRLKKREFVNNLMYTRDYLIKDEKDRKVFSRIISKL